MPNKYLPECLEELQLIHKKVKTEFGLLTPAQLNWQPAADKWSIAQCLDHLIQTNQQYFPILEGASQGTRKKSIMERIPFLPGFWGNLMLKAIDPVNAKPLKTPALFKPTASTLPVSIVADFCRQQQELIRLVQATDGVNHQKTIVSSPISGLITFSLQDCIRICTLHEERHFMQARRVQQAPGFPDSTGPVSLKTSV